MSTNHNGDPVEETELFVAWSERSTNEERDTTIGLILQHLNLKAIRTNATKHGNTEIQLRASES